MSLRARITAPEGPGEGSGGRQDGHLVSAYRAKLLEEIDLAEMSSLSTSERRSRLERVLGHIISREGPVLSTTERAQLIRRVVDEALGLGVLEPLLEDASITEIMVNGPDQIFVERSGRVEQVPVRFASEEQLMQTIERIVSTVNRRVDESNPMVDARLPSGERVNVIIPPLALTGATLTIRRFPRAYTLHELIGMGTLDEQMLMLLAALVRAKFNVVVSGPTGSGKTTLLNALSGLIPDGERIITVEDAAELQLQQTHVIRLESRPPNVEGKGRITIRDLVRNSLRMRPDRIIVGEVRGGETLDMLQAMSTGHDGSLATVHANSAEDALMRLQTLASMSEVAIPYEALRDQINSAVDCIVQLVRNADGSRRISEIALLDSHGHEAYRIATVCRFDAQPMGADRVVHGRFGYFPLPERVAERLRLASESVPPAFGVAAFPAQLATRAAGYDPYDGPPYDRPPHDRPPFGRPPPDRPSFDPPPFDPPPFDPRDRR
ncbi:CpaF family protein [Streptomyces antimycoticus]|uniref:CpaF family protein n=1 Tax=Streptomyces antimycoticus TaxID=68175 RepID=UPI0033ED97AC